MTHSLASNWWSLVVRGIFAIAAGLIATAFPGITITALVILFGAYALVDGVVGFIGAVRASRSHERWGFLLFEGITGILAAAITVFWPPLTAIVLIYLVAAWAIITGIFEIAAAIQLRRSISGEWLLALGGILSMVFGLFIMFYPLAGAIAITLVFGLYAMFFGIVLISLGVRLRMWSRRHASPGGAIPQPAH